MKKKIMIVLGSPRRKGNTAALGAAAAEAAAQQGAEVETLYLAELDIKPCTACDHCLKSISRECILKDDMIPLYNKLSETDCIVFATPVYWFNVSAQIKTFIDRLYAVGVEENNIFKGKTMAALLCYADKDPFDSGAVNALRSFQDMFKYLGALNGGMVYGSAGDPGEIVKNKTLMREASDLGARLAQS